MVSNQQIESLIEVARKFRAAANEACGLMSLVQEVDFFQLDLESWERFRGSTMATMKFIAEGSEQMVESLDRLVDEFQQTN